MPDVKEVLLEKKTSGGTVKNENIPNKELAEELHKPITVMLWINARGVYWIFRFLEGTYIWRGV